MKKIIVLIAIMGMVWPNLMAQNDIDALRYSLTSPLGSTARSMGLGGAIGALGADPATVLSNPAGLAQYKGGVFNISLGSVSLKNQSTYLDGATKNSNIFRPEMPSINLVFTDRKMRRGEPVKKGWINYNLLLGWNKTANFNRTMSFKGVNTGSSYTDYVAGYVQGLDASALDANDEQLERGFYYFENMFWYSYLIDSNTNGNYYANYDNLNTRIAQSGQIISKGGMNEFNLAFSGNYEHRLYFGIGLNINSINYSEKNVFSEVDNPSTLDNWSAYDFTRNLETNGYGYSGRFGLIFRPNKNIRVGGTVHTPAALFLADNYSDELRVVHDDNETDDLETVDKKYSYNIVSPMKYGVQAAYIFGKKGLVSAELESLDYSTMNISDDNGAYEDVNDNIANKYGTAVNLQLGAEYTLDAFRIRGGLASYGSPFSSGKDFSRKLVSAGVGIQERDWGFDFGLVKEFGKDVYSPYSVANGPENIVNSSTNSTRLVLTLTSKF